MNCNQLFGFFSLLFLGVIVCIASPVSAQTGGIISGPVGIDGDFNLDGVVDAGDFQVWRASLGLASDLSADGNGDGLVNLADYTVWRDSLGSDASAFAVTASSTTASIDSTIPSIDVSGVVNDSGDIDWTIAFTPAAPFSSIAVEIAIEATADIINLPADPNDIIAPNFAEIIEGTQILNPGVNPFDGTTNDGVVFFDETPSVIPDGPGGTVDGLFAALGSTAFSGFSPDAFPQEALTFTTSGNVGELFFDVRIFQNGALGLDTTGSVAVVPEPINALVLLLGLAGVNSIRLRR